MKTTLFPKPADKWVILSRARARKSFEPWARSSFSNADCGNFRPARVCKPRAVGGKKICSRERQLIPRAPQPSAHRRSTIFPDEQLGSLLNSVDRKFSTCFYTRSFLISPDRLCTGICFGMRRKFAIFGMHFARISENLRVSSLDGVEGGRFCVKRGGGATYATGRMGL